MQINQRQNLIRPAWIEVDLAQLKRNFEIINQDKPANLIIWSVVKDQAYGHGALAVAKIALEHGSKYLAVATIDEALELRQHGINAPILIFGERTEEELQLCLQHNFTCFINDLQTANRYAEFANRAGVKPCVQLEVDTGLSRYGVRWTEALGVIENIAHIPNLLLEGVMSHFAMSDELDKSFALLQFQRFQQVLNAIQQRGIEVKYRHICNTGGYLDLPQAHLDVVRIGILPLGVYPSQVCRRIFGLKPVMTVKAKIAAIKNLEVGDFVGYGMHYRAASARRIAVLPLGYGDGYPRVRNKGEVLVHGKRAAIIGGNAMDATMIDISDIPEAKLWDEVVLMGKQGQEEISVHELARLKHTVSYEVLTNWSRRL
ncbi:MAG: alanine racemase, partial [bacterium]